MNPRSWLRESALLWWMLAGPTGCSTWRVETMPAAELVEREHPARVRLRFAGHREVLYRPEVRGDSLWGRENLRARKAARVVALADVTQVETSHVSVTKTALLVVGTGVVVVVALAIAAASMDPLFQ